MLLINIYFTFLHLKFPSQLCIYSSYRKVVAYGSAQATVQWRLQSYKIKIKQFEKPQKKRKMKLIKFTKKRN